MQFLIKQVATCGCEILNENHEVVAWGIDPDWSETIAKALEVYLETEEDE
jgi:hypothetical protein